MPILYSYYGDDFTGSTDVLEQLGSNGIPAVLFIGTPSAAHLAEFRGVKAIGIAGDSRSRSPEWMSAQLAAIFSRLQEFGAPVTHYKVCSTFDSSPTCGSIGRAIEIGMEVFSPACVPIVVGAPHLRRYVAFGNLFAADADGVIQRIDRHPMSRHPVTPMHEADLQLHLAAQTPMSIGQIDLPALQGGRCSEEVSTLVQRPGHRAVLFDTIDRETQLQVRLAVWSHAQERPIFSAGSSGLTAALIAAWRAVSLTTEEPAEERPAMARPLLVVSGFCSVKTERQIRYALANGYRGIALDPVALLNDRGVIRNAALQTAGESLGAGQDTVLYTALGPMETTAFGARHPGVALGSLLRDLLARARVRLGRHCLESWHDLRRRHLIARGAATGSVCVDVGGESAAGWAALSRSHGFRAGWPGSGVEGRPGRYR